MDVALVANIAQGVGGLAGLISLIWQIVEAVQRRRRASWPPELRPVLVEVLRVSSKVDSSPQTRSWTDENVQPISEALQRAAELIDWKKRRDRAVVESALERIATGLAGMDAFASNMPYITRTAEEAGRHSVDQRNCARQARATAQFLLGKIE
ncbi:MAG: hypothetical protein WCF33_01210 [Pseudonocardiaceae bacterium]